MESIRSDEARNNLRKTPGPPEPQPLESKFLFTRMPYSVNPWENRPKALFLYSAIRFLRNHCKLGVSFPLFVNLSIKLLLHFFKGDERKSGTSVKFKSLFDEKWAKRKH